MRFICVTLCVFALCVPAFGQFNSSAVSVQLTHAISPVVKLPDEQVHYKPLLPPGVRMRNAGRVMTIIGGAMILGGIVMVSTADEYYYNYSTGSNGSVEEGDLKGALGVICIVAGTGLSVPGIILWTKGAKKYKRHSERETALNFKGNQLSLSYRF